MFAKRRLFTMLMICTALAALSFSAPTAVANTAKSSSLGAPACCYNPCIKYLSRGRKICCDCGPPQHVKLAVVDPNCCGCAVEVDVCMPACCKGVPCVDSRCGLFGRGIVWYEWSCGFKVRVVFTKHGNITVTSFGY